MASPQAPQKFLSENKITSYPIDGSYSTAADIDKWVDMRDYAGIVMLATGIALTGVGPEVLTIIADAESDGSGGNVEIAANSDAQTTEGDYMMVECTAEQIRQEGVDNSKELRYVSLKLENGNDADEAVVTYIRYGPRFAKSGLSVGQST